MHPVIIIGTGLAGYSVARELRKLNPEQPITLISSDAGDFYAKPMLSNAFAQGKTAPQLVNTPREKMAEQHQLTILAHTRVVSVDVAGKTVETASGTLLYHKLVLAIGADPIRLPLTGDAAGEVLSVNDIADYGVFRGRLEGKQHVTILGGGLIGCEFANDLAGAGYQVTVVDPGTHPLSSLMPPGAGHEVQQALENLGVQFRFGRSVQQVEAAADGDGFTLTEDNGDILDTDIVLSAVGLRPRTALAQAAGLPVNRGIVADATLRVTDDVYAIGDCAEIDGQWRPYVMPITTAARSLAQTLNGTETPVTCPAMPVLVKTPACPLLVNPPPRGETGSWQQEAAEGGSIWQFINSAGLMTGFVLTGKIIAANRQRMISALR